MDDGLSQFEFIDFHNLGKPGIPQVIALAERSRSYIAATVSLSMKHLLAYNAMYSLPQMILLVQKKAVRSC